MVAKILFYKISRKQDRKQIATFIKAHNWGLQCRSIPESKVPIATILSRPYIHFIGESK